VSFLIFAKKGVKKVNYEEEKRKYISFCGAYCKTCEWFTGDINKIFEKAKQIFESCSLERVIREKDLEAECFKKGLDILSKVRICSGCKAEIPTNSGTDRCIIRQCCFHRGYQICCECPDYPCETLKSTIGITNPEYLDNLEEIKEKGVKHFVERKWKEFLKGRL